MGLGNRRARAEANGLQAQPLTHGKPREQWVDAAKGIAIILVVFLHATLDFGYNVPLWWWPESAEVLETFRMPLFFFTAGLFATRALSMPFLGMFNHRVVRLIWLYGLWSMFAILLQQLFPHADSLLYRLAVVVIRPYPDTWFIYAMILYFLVAWLMRRLPVWVQLTLATGFAVIVHQGVIQLPTDEWYKIAQYFVFYLLATLIGPAVRRRVPGIRWPFLFVAPVIYVAGVATAEVLGVMNLAPVWLFLALLAIATGCSIAVALTRVPGFGWLTKLGSRTLQVYLLHWYFLFFGSMLIGMVTVPAVLVPFVVPALVVVSISGALLVHALTKGIPGLYDRPTWLVRLGARAVARWAPPPADPAPSPTVPRPTVH